MNYYKLTSANNKASLYACDSETKATVLVSKSEDLPLMNIDFIYLDNEFYQLFKKEDKIYGVYTNPMRHEYILETIIIDYIHRSFVLEGEGNNLIIKINSDNNSVTIKEVTIPGIHYDGSMEFKLDANNKPFNNDFPLRNTEVALISLVLDN